jgi:hypothetical protein
MLQGGCCCGSIRYETQALPFDKANCHCSLCRKTTGGTYVTWFTVPKNELRVVAGDPTRFASSAKGVRSFCPRCGTQLLFEHADRPDEIDVTTVSLDDPERVPPRAHIHVDTKLGWVSLNDDLPQLDS